MLDGFFAQASARVEDGRVGRADHHSRAVLATLGQVEADPLGLLGQQFVGHLEQDAGPVTGDLVAAGRPAVVQVQQHLSGKLDHPVSAPPGDVHHRPDAAAIVLEPRII